jgi:hypothetical protein
VHGDFGRTLPNVGSLLGCAADILSLDVMVWPMTTAPMPLKASFVQAVNVNWPPRVASQADPLLLSTAPAALLHIADLAQPDEE